MQNPSPLSLLTLQDLEIVYLHEETLRRPEFMKAVAEEIAEKVKKVIVEWKLNRRQPDPARGLPTGGDSMPPPPPEE